MAFYECVIITRQDLTTVQVDTLADDVTAILSEGGATVTKRENWGLRALLFRIRKNRKGHYLFFNIDGPAPALHEMERRLRINEDVIRHMVVRVEELEEAPSVMMQKSDRPDRPLRRGDRPERGDRPDRFDRSDRGPRRPRDETRDEEGAV